jgi:hypothetical protein
MKPLTSTLNEKQQAALRIALEQSQLLTAPPTEEPQQQTSAETGQWTASQWLASLDLASPVLAALDIPSGTARDYLQSLTRENIDARLRRAQLGGLVETVWAAIASLRVQPTPEELQTKFLQDGAGLLSYSGLDTFFGGLEVRQRGALLMCVWH